MWSQKKLAVVDADEAEDGHARGARAPMKADRLAADHGWRGCRGWPAARPRGRGPARPGSSPPGRSRTGREELAPRSGGSPASASSGDHLASPYGSAN
jgi:hypothetical protein